MLWNKANRSGTKTLLMYATIMTTPTLNSGNHRYFEVFQGKNTTLAHSDEPRNTQNFGISRKPGSTN